MKKKKKKWRKSSPPKKKKKKKDYAYFDLNEDLMMKCCSIYHTKNEAENYIENSLDLQFFLWILCSSIINQVRIDVQRVIVASLVFEIVLSKL